MGIREWSRLPEGMLLQSLFLWLLLQYHWEFPPSVWVLLEHMMFKSLIGHSFLKACSVYLNWQDNVDLSLYSTLETLASFPVQELQTGRPLLFSETPLNWLGPWISTWVPSVLSVGLEPGSFPRSSWKLLTLVIQSSRCTRAGWRTSAAGQPTFCLHHRLYSLQVCKPELLSPHLPQRKCLPLAWRLLIQCKTSA